MGRKLEAWGQAAEIVQAVVATIALGAGAWWFWVQREVYPRAELQQTIEIVSLPQRSVAVEVHARFENTGKQLIELSGATVSLQSISAEPYEIVSLAPLRDAEYWDASRPNEGANSRQFHAGELRWPIIKQFDGKIEHRIEPGETDILVFTFVIPCEIQFGERLVELGQVRVATDIHKPVSSDEKGLAWKARAFANLRSACGEGRRHEM